MKPSKNHICILSLALVLSACLLLLSSCSGGGSGKDSAGSNTSAVTFRHTADMNCASCHPAEYNHWSQSSHAASAADVLLNTDHNTEEILEDECIRCHSPFQAAAYHIGDFVQPIDQTGPWSLVSANEGHWEAIKCLVCHNPSSTAPKMLAFYNGETQSYEAVSDQTDLCERCHEADTDDSRDLAGSVHQGLQCTDCHKLHYSAQDSCRGCHALFDHMADVTTLDTTYRSPDSPNDIHFLTCTTCHEQRR